MTVYLRWDDGTGSILPSYWFDNRYNKGDFEIAFGRDNLDKATINPDGTYSMMIGKNIMCGTPVEKGFNWYNNVSKWYKWSKDHYKVNRLEVWTGRRAIKSDYNYFLINNAKFNFVPEKMIGKYSDIFFLDYLTQASTNWSLADHAELIERIALWNQWLADDPICLSEIELKEKIKDLMKRNASFTRFLLEE